ncbi:MFS transporter [Acinetobacter baumannii]
MSVMSHRTVLALLVAGTFFMENLDATIIIPAIPVMANNFGVQPIDLSIGISAYILTLGIFIPISGWVATRLGTKHVFILAIALFTLASLFCGLSTSLLEFVCMRILQGIGGALMVPVGRLIVLNETPKNELIQTIALLTWPALIALVLGPPLGGLIADYGNWRWIFWFNLPLGVISIILAWYIVPSLPKDNSKKFDWLGFLLISSGLFCFLVATELLSQSYIKWDYIILMSVLGIGLLTTSIKYIKYTPSPIFDLSALKFPSFAVTIYGGTLFRMSVSAVPFLLPLMFQISLGFNASSAGMMLMAVFAGNLVMKPMTTKLIQVYGFRNILIINGLINALLIASCMFFTKQTSLWLICTILFLGGMTRSMQFTAFNTIAFADIPKKQMNDANTLFSTIFQLAMGLGITLGAIAWHIGEYFAPDAESIWVFRIAFLIITIFSLLAVIDSYKLESNIGNKVLRK